MLRSIGQKVAALSGFVFILLCASAGLGLFVASELGHGLHEVERSADILHRHMEADMMHDALRADVLSAILAGSSGAGGQFDSIRSDAAEHVRIFRAAIASNEELVDEAATKEALDGLSAPLDAYIVMATDLVDLAARDVESAKNRLPEFQARFSELEDKMGAAAERIDASAGATSSRAEGQAEFGYGLMILVIAFGAVTAVCIAVFTRLSISKPIRLLSKDVNRLAKGDVDIALKGAGRRDEIGDITRALKAFQDLVTAHARVEIEENERRQRADKETMDRQSAIDHAKAEDLRAFVHIVEEGFERLSGGDLTVRMNGAMAPEFEPIRSKFNTSLEALESVIGSVVGSVGSIRTGLQEINVASSDLSQRTEQQAASLEETVAALTEVTRGVDGTAASAAKAQGVAATAQKNAEKGGSIVAEAIEAMSQIEQSSDKIGKIIGVIDEIAFQTNLLALNAGVEAARAGEAGRGFAVVAQEVRGLAQRSAEAAKEIKDLISTSSAQVEHGVELVSASGRSLDEIVTGVADMARVVSEIARSAREQAVSLKEVSTAADQMDKVTQQNAAMVEETTAAAQTLSGETQELAALTERFRVGAPVRPQAAARRAPSAPAARPVPQMRTTGTGAAGGAARKAETQRDDWKEF